MRWDFLPSKTIKRISATCLILALALLVLPHSAVASTQSSSGNINISATVPGLPPSTAPTIDSPTMNKNFDVKTITMNGGCISGLIVKVFRNTVFAGSTLCQANGTWSLQIDLVELRNDLIARQYDGLNQPSPDSQLVTVYYLPPASTPSLPGENTSPPQQTVGFQLNISYDYTVQGIFPGEVFKLPISFYGGNAPYAVSVDWGDGSKKLYSRPNNEQFIAEHIYSKPGLYTVTIQVSDIDGNTAYLQFILVVNGRTNSPFNAINPFNGQAVSTTEIGIAVGLTIFGIGGGVRLERHWLSKRRAKKKKKLQHFS